MSNNGINGTSPETQPSASPDDPSPETKETKPKAQLSVVPDDPKAKKVAQLRPKPKPSPKWLAQIKRKGKYYKTTLESAEIALTAEFGDGLCYDTLALRVDMLKPPISPPWPKHEGDWKPRPWDDQDDRLFALYMQSLEVDVTINTIAEAVETVARRNEVHPIKQYLESLHWDGQERLKTWLAVYFGAVESEYHAVVGTKWLISAVARAMQPGCKVDCMLILEGAQGAGKGRCLQALVPVREWFTDNVRDFGTIESARQLAGKWIVESSELEGIKGTSGRKAISEGVKAFLSRSTDNYRAPYGRRAKDHDRQCVFAGTTNQSQIFTDVTGGRRFWPVSCTTAKPEELAAMRDQLWAESLHNFRLNVRWWLDETADQALASQAVEERFEIDPLEPLVLEYVNGQVFVSTSELLPAVLSCELAKVTRSDSDRVSDIMVRLGWVRGRSFRKETYNQRGWLKK